MDAGSGWGHRRRTRELGLVLKIRLRQTRSAANFVVRVFRGNWAYFSLANFGFLQRHFGWGRDRVRRGRPGLAGSAPSGLVAVGVPAANSLSRIFVRVGNGLNGPTFTIPDSMPGSLDCAARELQSPGYSVDTVTNATMPQAVDGLRNSSTTVRRRMLASIKSVEEVLGGGLLLIRHYHAKNRDSGMVVCKLLILRGRKSFFPCD